MGYTTEFEGHFSLNKKLSEKRAQQLIQFSDTRHEGPTNVGIGIWCDWVPTTNRKGICWSGAEKFYDYVKWLQYIISTFLIPWGLTLNGEVRYQGEELQDAGYIIVKNNVVTTDRLISRRQSEM